MLSAQATVNIKYLNSFLLVSGVRNNNYLSNTEFRSPGLNKFGQGSKLYSTDVKKANIASLIPWFVTGFCDGEANFMVSVTPRADSKLKCRVRIRFQLILSIKEMPLLVKIKKFFGGVGVLKTEQNNRASYVVYKLSDILKVIIPHFLAYPLITQKRKDFILWSKVANMMSRKEHLTIKGLYLILQIRLLINRGVNEKVTDLLKEFKYLFVPAEEFTKVLVDTSDLEFKITSIPSPYWIVGFVAAEGSFSASPYSEKLKAYRVRFLITQHKRDLALLKLIVSYLGIGNIYKNGVSAFNYEVSSYKKNYETILPFFLKYPLPPMCLKATNFLIWKQITEIMHLGLHKTSLEHKSKMDKLISTINK